MFATACGGLAAPAAGAVLPAGCTASGLLGCLITARPAFFRGLHIYHFASPSGCSFAHSFSGVYCTPIFISLSTIRDTASGRSPALNLISISISPCFPFGEVIKIKNAPRDFEILNRVAFHIFCLDFRVFDWQCHLNIDFVKKQFCMVH